MTKQTPSAFPVGAILVDGHKTSRIVALLDGLAILRPTGANANDMQDFSMTVDEIHKSMNRVDFEIKFPTGAYMKSATAMYTHGVEYVDLGDEAQQKVLFAITCCMALESLRDEGFIKITEPSIDKHHHLVEKRIHEMYQKVTGVAKRGNRKRCGYEVPRGETLMSQYNAYKRETFDPANFNPKHKNAGRPKKQFPQWVLDLMQKCLTPHLDGREPAIIRCYEVLEGTLSEENARRAVSVPDHEDVKVSERKFRELAYALKPTALKITRKGWEKTKNTLRAGIGEINARMIGEVVEIDECQMPLWVFLEKTGLHAVVGDRTMRQLKSEAKDTEKGKVWILVAVDVATGAPLAFHLAKAPNADDTVELLRRLVSDKTKLAKEAGCVHQPPPPVRPHLVVMDTGSGLWNNVVPRAILSLGGAFRFGRTKSPTDKAFIERFFGTLGSDLMRALHGYSGQGPGKETDYDGTDMTVMTMAQLEKYLWWYFTDCLPFKPTQRKGAWGSLRNVLFNKMEQLYGKLPALSHRQMRRAIGLRVTRTVTKMGVEAFRMPFQGDEAFRGWALANVGSKVTICIDPHRIEEVTAITAKGEVHYLTPSLSQFRHLSLAEWIHFIEEWRATDPLTEEIAVEALYRFHLRISAEMDDLLAFHGKEHKVIRIEDAQRLADSLAGGNLTILHGDNPSDTAALSALTASDAIGQGVYKPGGEVVERKGAAGLQAAGSVANNEQTEMKSVKEPRKFTGAPKGKGGLK